jgi:hypothetical protein
MGTMPSSGAISFNDLRTQLGPSSSAAPVPFSDYYRGGSYVPGTTTAGPYYSEFSPQYYWLNYIFATGSVYQGTSIWWNDVLVWSNPSSPGATATTVTVGSTTYTRGSLYTSIYDDGTYYNYYYVSQSIAKNAGVPTSGTISLSNMYGASNP